MAHHKPMFDHFATASHRAVVAAQNIARDELHYGRIDSGHLLLAIWRDGSTAASQILDALGVTEQIVLRIAGEGYLAPSGCVPLAENLRRVIKLARQEADELGHSKVTPEHLLLALFRDPVLHPIDRLAVDATDVRIAIFEHMLSEV
ncbi:MAG TPA: Clp protease N-terminal domain-containing protein [Candidatus Saccharimonadia bacterium]